MDKSGAIIFNLLTAFVDNYINYAKEISSTHFEIGSGILIISYIGDHKGCNMSDIVEYLRVPPSTATRHINKIVEKGYIRRVTPEKNRRIVNLRLTEKGSAVYEEVNRHKVQFMDTVITKFNAEQLAIIVDFLNSIDKSFNKIPHQLSYSEAN